MFKGRALLVIDRVDSKYVPWDIHEIVQSLNKDDPGGEVQEAFSCAASDCLPMPDAAHKMKVGDRIRVLVHFEIHYHRDYFGEWDIELYYERQKVLRRQPYKNTKKSRKFRKGETCTRN